MREGALCKMSGCLPVCINMRRVLLPNKRLNSDSKDTESGQNRCISLTLLHVKRFM
jgi:hypothetical protein